MGDKPRAMQWWDREGAVLESVGEPTHLWALEVSPDGKSVTLVTEPEQGGSLEVWVHDLERGARTRLTSDAGDQFNAIWAPDGRTVYYSSNHADGRFSIYRKPVGGVSEAELVVAAEEGANVHAQDISPDGKFLLYLMRDIASVRGFWIVELDEPESPPRPLIASDFRQGGAQFSPDGKWIAYSSDESGRTEAYVTSFPEADRRWPVSTGGGQAPFWRADGRTILFTDAEGRLVSIDVDPTGAEPSFGTPEPLFKLGSSFYGQVVHADPDGQRFLVLPEPELDRTASVELMLGWPALLGD